MKSIYEVINFKGMVKNISQITKSEINNLVKLYQITPSKPILTPADTYRKLIRHISEEKNNP